jgi:hypothetical protein
MKETGRIFQVEVAIAKAASAVAVIQYVKIPKYKRREVAS